MRIDLAPFVEWGTRRRVWLRPERLVDAAGVAVVIQRRVEAHQNAGRSGWAEARVGVVTSFAGDGEVGIAWEPGFENIAGWADLMDFGYDEIAPDCPDVSDDPTTYVPAEWRLVNVVLVTPEEAIALAETNERALQ